MFNAAPGATNLAALEAWVTANPTATTADLAVALGALSEFSDQFTGMTDAQVAAAMAANFGLVAGTTGGDAAIAYFTQELAAGTSKAVMLGTANDFLLNSDAATLSGFGLTDAATVLTNKTTVAEYYSVTVAQSGATMADLQTALSGVDETAASVTTAQTAIDAVAAGQTVGTTFTLTNSSTADTVIGTSGNDTINGASGTVANGDLIIDQSTTDNDTANLVLTTAYTPSTITNIENVNIDWNAFGTATVNAAGITGTTTVTGTSSKTGFLGHLTVTNAADLTIAAGTGMDGTLTVSGIEAGTVTGGEATTIVANASATAADATSMTVNAGSNATSVTVGTTNGAKSTTVDAGTATTISVADQGNSTDTTALTVGASAAITLANTGSTTMTVNTDALTSTMTLTTIGQGLTIDGSAASHTIDTTAAGLSGETITNSLTSGTLTVNVGAVGADTNLALVQADTFNFDTLTGGDFATAFATGANIEADVNLAAGEFGVLTANDTSADTMTITNNVATQTVIQVDGTDATLGDIETLNIVSAATAVTGTDATYTAIEASTNKVVMTGTNDVVVTDIIAGEFDASGLTGNLTSTSTTDAAMTVSGSTGTNTHVFASTTTDSSYTGQDGNDTVTFVNNSGNATAVLGNGTNIVTASSSTTGSVVVIGGTGVDTVTATTAGTGTGEVNLSLAGGNDVMTVTQTGANDVVTVNAGDGDDALTLGAASTASDVYSLTFGAGTDTLNISADMTAGTWTLSGLDTIAIGSSDTAAIMEASELTGQSYTITGDGTATDHMAVETDTAGTYDFSSIAVDQTITSGLAGLQITGSTGNDTITGTDYADILISNGGTDTLTGGTGKDTYTGGAGTDTFVIASADTGATVATADVINVANFTTTTDKLSLGTAGSATNYTEIAGVDGDAIADTLVDVNAAMDGTIKYVLVYGLDVLFATGGADAADGALFIDADMDGTSDDMIIITGENDGTNFAYGDIIA
jgi:hypothetical protein